MPQTIHHVQPALTPIPPQFSPIVLRLVHLSLPLILRLRTRPWLPAGITQIEATHLHRLVDLYDQFQRGKLRFILAFRHVEVDDPLCGLYLLSRLVPAAARQQERSLQLPLHAHFLYDRGMPLWGGVWLGWLLSRLGGVTVHRGKRPDWLALRSARELVTQGAFPFAVAPEGATNGHSEIISPLEPGVAQLGFWAVEDLLKAGRSESVWIVPIGLQYRYITPPWRALDRLMSRLEADAGLSVQPVEPIAETERAAVYRQRLLRLGEQVLTTMEQFYSRFYPRSSLPPTPAQSDSVTPSSLDHRLQVLLDRALRVAEAHFGLTAQGHVSERCRRIEEAGWTQIYRPDVPDPAQLSSLERGLADWVAEEASLRLIHMRLAESFVAVTETYVATYPTIERLAEMTLLMFDLMARIRGDKLPHRPRLGYRQAQFTIGEPISVTDRWPQYQIDRRSARRSIDQLTQDIRLALEQTIVTMR